MEEPTVTSQPENNDELGMDELDAAAGGTLRDDDSANVQSCRELLLLSGCLPLFAE